MRTAHFHALLLFYMAALCWPLVSQQKKTLIPLDAIEADPLDWQWKPSSPLSRCIAGQISVDTSYNVYLCMPDRNYMIDGHKPYIWIRIKPDPAFIPPGYLDPPPVGVAPKQ